MTEKELNFEALEKLNMPAIPAEAFGGEALPGLNEKQIEQVAEDTVTEVNSLEEFEKPAKPAESTSKPNEEELEEEELENEEELEEESQEAAGEEPETSVVQGIAEWAKAKGLFDYKDEEFEDSEDFLEKKLIEKSKSYNEEWKESLPPAIKELINNYEEGVPLDEIIYSKSREIEYSQIDEKTLEEREDLQKKLIADWLVNQDYDDYEIKKRLGKLEENLMLEDEAKIALKKLKAYEAKYQENLKAEAKANKIAQEKAFQDQIKRIEEDITKSSEIIKGIQISKEEKKQLIDAYTKIDSKGKTALMKAIENDPQAWYKITQFMVLMNGDLSKVKTSATTEVTKKVKEAVNTYKETPGLGKLSSPEALKAMKKAVKLSQKARSTD